MEGCTFPEREAKGMASASAASASVVELASEESASEEDVAVALDE